ncbi:MAG: carboxypeptidase regulatory-like domain-containing protein [Bryobacterales bacterium]|nr:carboxypeptidase regulatory-like domain-containing protein [Bryobacterales bacterium]
MKLSVFLLTVPLMAAVDGTVFNKTSGKPQAGATVSIYKLTEAGPESLETVKSDAAGKYQLQANPASGPHYVQVAFEGVLYTKMMPPGSPTTNVQVDVFSSSPKPGDAKITQHMMLFEPMESKLVVTENFIYQNNGNTAYNEPEGGTLRFYMPPETQGKVRISATAPQSVAVERSAIKTGTANVYGVDFAIKPGETRFQLSYEMPLADPPVFEGKLLYKGATTRLVTPRGVTLKAENISELGREPATQAAIYDVKGPDLKLEISGSGSLREPESTGGEEEGPSIQEVMPRVYDQVSIVLALAIGILILGFALIYRQPGRPATVSASAEKGKRRG